MAEQEKDTVFGPVRSDIDAAAQHADASLGLADNLLKWGAVLVAGFTTGKKVVRMKVDSLDPLTVTTWVEDKK